VLDFVGEGDAVACGLAMTRNAGSYYVVGWGRKIEVPTLEMIVTEKSIIGDLVGNYAELFELMELAYQGRVTLATKEYPLSEASGALRDLHAGRVRWRAVLIP